jgi:hypothetical protein
MTEDDARRAFNVLCGLNGDGLNRQEEVEAEDGNKPERAEHLRQLRERIAAADISHHCCTECDWWDGLHRRCSCGNRRLYWAYDPQYGYQPEAY